eukprot:4133165-Karenia_brevis.AAC.1
MDRGSVVSFHRADGELFVRMATPKQAERIFQKMEMVSIVGGAYTLRLNLKKLHPAQLGSHNISFFVSSLSFAFGIKNHDSHATRNPISKLQGSTSGNHTCDS